MVSQSRRNEITPPVPVEHRMEIVRCVRGINYIDDAMAHNSNMVWYAMECIDAPVVWITVGSDKIKSPNYTFLRPIIKEKVKVIINIGFETNNIEGAFMPVLNSIIKVDNLDEALFMAKRYAEGGDYVLFSPLCQLDGYDVIGRNFKKRVKNLSF